MKYILIAYLTAACCVVAVADEVRLTNGRTLVGIAREEEPNRVVVETGLGDLRFPREEVQSIERGRTHLHEYRERAEAIGTCPSAADLFALAQWAQERRLIRYVNSLLTQAIELEPDHEGARTMMGYVRFEGQWMFPGERRSILAKRDAERRAISQPRTVAVRRTTPRVEETPYSLGLPMLPSRSTTNVYPERRGSYSTGGYTLSIGGVTPGGDVVIPVVTRPAIGR